MDGEPECQEKSFRLAVRNVTTFPDNARDGFYPSTRDEKPCGLGQNASSDTAAPTCVKVNEYTTDGKTSDSLSRKQLDACKEAFDAIDEDGNGVITSTELGKALRLAGHNPTKEEIRKIIADVDGNGNGTIEFEEFIHMVDGIYKNVDEEEELKQSFKLLDKDSDGFISFEELKRVLRSVGEVLDDNEMDQFIKDADIDKDGRINLNEFVKVMMA